MIDLCLRAADEAALAAACPFLRGLDLDGAPCWQNSGEGFAFDLIGSITLAAGVIDEDGNIIEPPVIDERFHANLRATEDVAALVPADVIVTPESPVRVWA